MYVYIHVQIYITYICTIYLYMYIYVLYVIYVKETHVEYVYTNIIIFICIIKGEYEIVRCPETSSNHSFNLSGIQMCRILF